MKPLLALAVDKIPNVRLACIRVFLASDGFFASPDNLAQMDEKLRLSADDKDRDCRQVARQALGMETEHSILLSTHDDLRHNGDEQSSEC